MAKVGSNEATERIPPRIRLLLVIPVVGALAALAVFVFILKQTSTATLYVDLAGRQRLLAGQLAHAAEHFSYEGTPRTREALTAFVAQFDSALHTLEHGGEVPGRQGRLPPAPGRIIESLHALTLSWTGYRQEISMLLDRGAGSRDVRPLRDQLQARAQDLTAAVDHLIRTYATWQDQQFRLMLGLLAILALLDILALAVTLGVLSRYARARAQAEDALRQGEERFRGMVESSSDWLWETDAEARYTYASPRIRDLLGYEPEEMIGHRPVEFMAPGDAAEVERLFGDFVRERRPFYRIENTNVHKGGHLVVLESSAMPIFDAAGNLRGYRGIDRDVTDRKRSETALWEAHKNLMAVFNATRESVMLLDTEGEILTINETGALRLGRSPEELIGTDIWLHFPPEVADFRKSKLQEALRLGKPVNFADERDHACFEVTLYPILSQDSPGRIVVYVTDITEQRRLERAQRDSEKLFRELAENIRDVFYVRDLDTNKMIYVSPVYETLWGQLPKELYSDPRAFLRAVHPEDRPYVLAAIQAQDAGGPYFNREYRIITRAGETRWVWARTFPVQDERGQVHRVAGIVEDITVRKTAEQERLEQARRQRDTLVREVHHRIKNNLQGVVGLIRRHADRNPAMRESVEEVITQVNAVAVVHGLQEKEGIRSLMLCDMTMAIAEAVVGLTGATVEPVVERLVAFPIGVAEEEAVSIALILNELIVNAVKHGEARDGEPVQVSLDRVEDRALVRIINRARSLPPGFDFAAGRSLGTGLSLVRSLLPAGSATLSFQMQGDHVITELWLKPPVVVLPAIDAPACSGDNGVSCGPH
jgi:PAS domain S-box-containing protein